MAMTDYLAKIMLASQFDAKGFKQAETATAKLGRSVKNLGRTLGLTLSATAITAYGKAAVKAASDDAKAQAILAQQLKNVGQAYAVSQVEAYIATQEKLSGILDDTLRPSFAKLITVTGSATESQYLLSVAMDAAAGTGQDLESVSQSLTQAYQGNTKGLKSLNLGWTAAQLKGKKFADIVERINTLYKGQAKVSADSYAGSIAKIDVAAKNASETIGFALINALTKLSGNTSIDGLVEDIDRAASGMDKLIGKFATGGKAANDYFFGPIATGFEKLIQKTQGLADLFFAGDPSTLMGSKRSVTGSRSGAASRDRLAMAQAKKAAQLQKEKNQLQTIDNQSTAKKIALSGDQLALQALQKIFDTERVGLHAALTQATDQETQARLKGLIVIKDQDAAQAKLALAALGASGALDAYTKTIMAQVKSINAALQAAIDSILTMSAASGARRQTAAQAELDALGIPQGYGDMIVPQSIASASDFYTNPNYEQYRPGVATINIALDGQVFQSAVVSAVNQASVSGTPLNYDQTALR